MEEHQLAAQAIRHQNTTTHHRRRINPYVVSPVIHVSSLPQTPSEEQSYIEVAIEREIATSLHRLATKMQHQSQDAEACAGYNGDQEHLVENFHKELETCREGLHTRILQPLFMELISMYHDFGRLIDDTITQMANTATERTIKNMESFQETLEDILQRYGVETFCVEQNTFLTSRQRILHVIPTSDPALDRRIARRVRKGFQYKGKVLSPEVVIVYKTVATQ